ncbi:hypothetical protein Tco_1357129 [Tanacetum coccineum]
MVDDQPMWANNRAVAPTPVSAIVAVDLGDNFTMKGHHLSVIIDCQFDGHAWADPHKHIAEFIKILGKGNFIQIFYHGLNDATQAILDVEGTFLDKTSNEAHKLLEHRGLLKVNWSKYMKAKPQSKTVSFAESSETSKLMEKMESLTTKIDLQFKEIKGEMKEIQDGCRKFGGPHPSPECDNKPMRGPEEEANYTYRGYRGGGYPGKYYDRNSKNWNDRQPRDDHRYSPPREDDHSTPSTPEKET